MARTPSYEDLRQRVHELEQEHQKRIQAEEESEARQKYLEGVLHSAPDAVVTLDSLHRVVEWNAGAQRIFGYSAREVKGRDLDELITRFDEVREARDYTRHVLDGNSVDAVESVRYTKEGNPVHVLVSGSPIIRDDRLFGVVAIYTDVTERKRMEEALHASERKYRAIFENTGTATAIVEKDTTVSMINSEMENLSGYTRLEIEGRIPFTRLIAHESDREKMLANHWKRREDTSGAPKKYEAVLLTKAERRRNVIVTVDIIPDTEQSIVSFLDITHFKELQEAYKQERDYLDQILEHSPDGIAIANKRGELTRFNRIAAEISGYTSEEIHGRLAYDFFEDTEEMERVLGMLRSKGAVRNHEIDFLRKDGTRIPCSVSISLLRDREGAAIGSITILRDLREWKDMLQTLREEEEKFKGIASSALDAIIMMDDAGRISYWNPAAEKIFGYSAREILDRDLHELLAPSRYHAAFEQGFAEFRRSGKGYKVGRSVELRALHKNGTEFPVEISLSPLELSNAWHSVGIVRDISDRKIMEEKLRNMANTDQLTGAYNRHKFLECLDYEIKRVQRNKAPLSLVMLDIDHFKRINDTYGHSTGDTILRELVRIIRNGLRQVDVLTRWGGEEFLILLPDTKKLDAASLAERLRSMVSDHDFPQAGHVTISLGIAELERNESVEDFINRVDEHMYLAKQSGRNRVK